MVMSARLGPRGCTAARSRRVLADKITANKVMVEVLLRVRKDFRVLSDGLEIRNENIVIGAMMKDSSASRGF